MNPAPLAAAGLLLIAAWYYTRPDGDTLASDTAEPGDWGDLSDTFTDTANTVGNFIDEATGGMLKISTMRGVSAADVAHPNVQALLRVIRAGEGTSDPDGYRRIFGGKLFTSYADHPRQTVRANGYTSTAAGAYQFLASTWDETRRIMGLQDFSPRSQDFAAVGRIQARGALDDAKAGRLDAAIKKVAREWASLPGSPYGQPVISWDKARALYAQAGGEIWQTIA